jgi:hypothetical protein
MAELPPDLEEIQNGLQRSDREAQALIATLDEERFNWRPDPRSWSIAQCLDHLNVANRVYLEPIQHAIEQARSRSAPRRGPIQPRLLERWFIRSLEPASRPRLPAPRKIVPAARRSRGEVQEEWERIQARLQELLQVAAPLDLNKTRFVNPFIPLVRFSVGTGFRVIEVHERRHLQQAERVRRQAESAQPEQRS